MALQLLLLLHIYRVRCPPGGQTRDVVSPLCRLLSSIVQLSCDASVNFNSAVPRWSTTQSPLFIFLQKKSQKPYLVFAKRRCTLRPEEQSLQGEICLSQSDRKLLFFFSTSLLEFYVRTGPRLRRFRSKLTRNYGNPACHKLYQVYAQLREIPWHSF